MSVAPASGARVAPDGIAPGLAAEGVHDFEAQIFGAADEAPEREPGPAALPALRDDGEAVGPSACQTIFRTGEQVRWTVPPFTRNDRIAGPCVA